MILLKLLGILALITVLTLAIATLVIILDEKFNN